MHKLWMMLAILVHRVENFVSVIVCFVKSRPKPVHQMTVH
jgi:hypothetical protein